MSRFEYIRDTWQETAVNDIALNATALVELKATAGWAVVNAATSGVTAANTSIAFDGMSGFVPLDGGYIVIARTNYPSEWVKYGSVTLINEIGYSGTFDNCLRGVANPCAPTAVLASTIDAQATTVTIPFKHIPVDKKWTPSGVILIGSEEIYYDSVTYYPAGNSGYFTAHTATGRGYNSTTAAAHTANDVITEVTVAAEIHADDSAIVFNPAYKVFDRERMEIHNNSGYTIYYRFDEHLVAGTGDLARNGITLATGTYASLPIANAVRVWAVAESGRTPSVTVIEYR